MTNRFAPFLSYAVSLLPTFFFQRKGLIASQNMENPLRIFHSHPVSVCITEIKGKNIQKIPALFLIISEISCSLKRKKPPDFFRLSQNSAWRLWPKFLIFFYQARSLRCAEPDAGQGLLPCPQCLIFSGRKRSFKSKNQVVTVRSRLPSQHIYMGYYMKI